MRQYRHYNRHRSTGTPRFDDFHELVARRASTGCVNGADHAIQAGNVIGWSRRHRVACCATCWAKWSAENREADLIEQGYTPCPW